MENVQSLVTELHEKLPALSAWGYIAIWSFADMFQRMQTHPENPRFDEILFPHTRIPLFEAAQAKDLEKAWRSALQQQTTATAADKQTGGAIPFPPTRADAQKAVKAVGSATGALVQGVDPEAFSLDRQFKGVTGTLDALDEQITDLSKQYGLVALESVAPDPKFVIPLPVPIPVIFPVRMILPILNVVLESLRVASTLFPVTEILGKPVTLLMGLLDLARGNVYHAMFTFIGFYGRYPMYAGILLKILRDAYVLIAPDIRDELREALFKSGKSFVTGFMIWLFAVVSPEIVRKPIVKVLDQVRQIAENWNDTMTKAEVQATARLRGFGRVELPKLPSTRIPSIGDLYILQSYIHHPRIYCHPSVSPLIQQMRSIPPLAVFFDLLNIPAPDSEAYRQACANVEAVPLAQSFAPKVVLTDPRTGAEVDLLPLPAPPGSEPAVAV